MPLESLPFELFIQVFQDLKDLHGTYSGTLKNLRLTSKALNATATVALFDCVLLSVRFPRSWEVIQHIAHQEKLADAVQSLSLNIWKRRPYPRAKVEKGYRGSLDLGLFPNLASISINRDDLLLRRRGIAEASTKAYRVSIAKKSWHTISRFIKLKPKSSKKLVSRLISVAYEYGFELASLQMNLPSPDQYTWNVILPAIDLRCLKSLKLEASYLTTRTQERELRKAIPRLYHLPALVYLTIQDGLVISNHPGKEARWRCDIIEMLQNQHWPSVKHLRIELPRTRLSTIQAFLSLYKGQLESLHLHGAFPRSEEIEMDSSYLESTGHFVPRPDCGPVFKTWIEENIKPKKLTTSEGECISTPLTLRDGQIQLATKNFGDRQLEMDKMATWAGKDLWWCSDWKAPS